MELGQRMRAEHFAAVVADQAAGFLARRCRRRCDRGASGLFFLGDFGLDVVERSVLVVP
jgi:hypothetical protein